MHGVIYLLPNFLAEPNTQVFGKLHKSAIENTRLFIVENLKPARRLLRKLDANFPIDESVFYKSKDFNDATFLQVLEQIINGKNAAIISDAGMPAIADPGTKWVAAFQHHNCNIISLPGPNSIIQALASSGLNGQNFQFHGYLPIQKVKLQKKLLQLTQQAQQQPYAHIFIETPYRNNQLINAILKLCDLSLNLCIAANLMYANQFVKTRTIAEWRKAKRPDIHKKPAIFILGQYNLIKN